MYTYKNNVVPRKIKSKSFGVLITLLALLTTLPLLAVLYYIIRQGITAINWHFLVSLPRPVGEKGGGIANALAGTIIIIGVAALIATPFGILSGIYLSENKHSWLARSGRFVVNILQGIPSIVIGIVVYFWLVKPFGGFSGFSGSVALAVMMLPILVRTTEETLKLLPASLKEASYALGGSYANTFFKIIIPCGLSGIVSGILLAIARIAGETAPLLFTAFGSPYMNTDVSKPMQSLPLLIYNYATSPYHSWHNLAWGASVILLLWILILNMLTKFSIRKWNIQF